MPAWVTLRTAPTAKEGRPGTLIRVQYGVFRALVCIGAAVLLHLTSIFVIGNLLEPIKNGVLHNPSMQQRS